MLRHAVPGSKCRAAQPQHPQLVNPTARLHTACSNLGLLRSADVSMRPSRWPITCATTAAPELAAPTHNGTDSAASRAPADQVAVEGQHATFQWTSYWYPVQAVANLDPKAPTAVDLLGKKLVVWADKAGAWHCVEDRCPHRLAPLSEGRVSESGNLQCSYHGWEFTASGSCARIPQLDDPKAHATACASQRACVASYPTREDWGLLWVWPQTGPQAAAAAAKAETTHLDRNNMTHWFVRDLPIRYDTLLENVVDPSHVPFSHHGVQGNRNNPSVLNFKVEPVTKMGGIVSEAPTPRGNMSLTFTPPFTASYKFPEAGYAFDTLIVPTKPGWSRIHATFTAVAPKAPPPIKLIMKLMAGLPAVEHATQRNAVLDGDTYMLHVAERLQPMSQGVGTAVLKGYHAPAPADAVVLAMRQWISDFAGEVPTCSPADEARMPPVMTKQQVLDRYEQHTKHCSHCKSFVAKLDAGSTAAAVVGALAATTAAVQALLLAAAALTPAAAVASVATSGGWGAVVAAAAASTIGLLKGCGAAIAVAALCALLYQKLQSFRGKYFYEEYIHAHRD